MTKLFAGPTYYPLKRMGYKKEVLCQTACLLLNPVMADTHAFLIDVTKMGCISDSNLVGFTTDCSMAVVVVLFELCVIVATRYGAF